MRKVIAGAFVSLDGVMQAPGGPEEDPDRRLQVRRLGRSSLGWGIEAAMNETFSAPFDLLLGRKTYDIFAAHWPYVEHDPAASSFDELNSNIASASTP